MSEFIAKIDEVTGTALEIVVPLSLLQDIQGQLGATWSEKIENCRRSEAEAEAYGEQTGIELELFYRKQAQDILDLQHEIDKVAGFDVSSS